MLITLGGAILVAIWAFLIAWIARLTATRGRSVIGWTLVAANAGVGGFVLSLELVRRAADADIASNWWLISVFAPLVLVIGPMIAIGALIAKLPVRVARRLVWRVHATTKGDGKLTIRGGELLIEWKELQDRVALDRLRDVRVDGECLRIAWTEGMHDIEQVLMPMERPQTRAGRQAQAAALARELGAKPK
jgi:hypothetical protein